MVTASSAATTHYIETKLCGPESYSSRKYASKLCNFSLQANFLKE